MASSILGVPYKFNLFYWISPTLTFGIVANALTLLLDNLSRNGCILIYRAWATCVHTENDRQLKLYNTFCKYHTPALVTTETTLLLHRLQIANGCQKERIALVRFSLFAHKMSDSGVFRRSEWRGKLINSISNAQDKVDDLLQMSRRCVKVSQRNW